MKVEIFTLCQYAAADGSGQLTIVGAFDHVKAVEAPVTILPMCAVAARLRFEQIEDGMKNISVAFVDADGKEVIPSINNQIPVRAGDGESTVTVHFVALAPRLKLPRFGEYQVDLAIDSRIEASIPLYVRQIKGPLSWPRLGSPPPANG